MEREIKIHDDKVSKPKGHVLFVISDLVPTGGVWVVVEVEGGQSEAEEKDNKAEDGMENRAGERGGRRDWAWFHSIIKLHNPNLAPSTSPTLSLAQFAFPLLLFPSFANKIREKIKTRPEGKKESPPRFVRDPAGLPDLASRVTA